MKTGTMTIPCNNRGKYWSDKSANQETPRTDG